MTLWRVGMLAVALDTSPNGLIVEGNVYQVIHVNPIGGKFNFNGETWTNNSDDVFLRFRETSHLAHGGPAHKFRPAVLDWQSETQSHVSWLDDIIKGRVPAP